MRHTLISDIIERHSGFKIIIFHARPEMELANKVLDLRNVNQVLLGEGVETDFEYNADRFRKKYNINEPYIIYAGRKDEAKNIYTLIKYFMNLQEEILIRT